MHINNRYMKKKTKIIEKASRIDFQILSTPNILKKKLYNLRRQFLSYYFIPPPFWRVLLRAASPAKRARPDFACIGPVRSGTTLLTDYIMQHPAVVLPLAKELNIKNTPMMRLVMAQFPTEKKIAATQKRMNRAITGFCSPVVPGMLFPYFARNVSDKAKIIIIFRNPVDRTFSHWRWDQQAISGVRHDPIWKDIPGFAEIINMEIKLTEYGAGAGTSISGTPVGGYIQGSIYFPFVDHLFKFYDRKQVMVINADEFFRDTGAVVKRVYAFLDLPAYEPIPTPVKNAGPKMEMDKTTKKLLGDFFAPLNQKLYKLIDQDFDW